MTNRTKSLLVVASALLVAVFAGTPASTATAAWAAAAPAVAGTPAPLGSDPIRERVATAQRRFHQEVFAILSARWPDLRELLALQRDLQIALVDQRSMRFYYVKGVRPSQLRTHSGAIVYGAVEWTPQDERTLLSRSRAYAAIAERVRALRARNDGHPQWPEARERFAANRNDPQIRDAFQRLNAEVAIADRLLRARERKAR